MKVLLWYQEHWSCEKIWYRPQNNMVPRYSERSDLRSSTSYHMTTFFSTVYTNQTWHPALDPCPLFQPLGPHFYTPCRGPVKIVLIFLVEDFQQFMENTKIYLHLQSVQSSNQSMTLTKRWKWTQYLNHLKCKPRMTNDMLLLNDSNLQKFTRYFYFKIYPGVYLN